MDGLSAVRLSLHRGELLEEHARVVQISYPPGLGRWGLFCHRWVTRKALLELTVEQLRDVGLSWEQARTEGLKPFWKD